MSEQKEFKLFREKSLEAVESPESLNDYLKVTSPGIWLTLVAVILLLVGVLCWSVFGRIQTTQKAAVVIENGQAICMVPYDDLEAAMTCGSVLIDDTEYTLNPDTSAQAEVVSEDTNAYILAAGGLAEGDIVVEVPVVMAQEPLPEDGVYSASLVTENLQPISLLLQ